MPESLDQPAFHGEDNVLTHEIEEFARILVQKVRDASIQSSDRELQPNARSPVAARWRQASKHTMPDAFAEVLIPDIVDDTVFYMLHAIDQGLLHLKFVSSSGKEVDLAEDGLGELAGWYMGSGGWRAMHSEERFVDDFADLDPP